MLVLLATGLALSLVFTGMAFVIALGFQDRAAGLAAAILAWLSATVLYDGLVLMAVVLLREYPLERPLVAGMLLNPVDLARVLLLPSIRSRRARRIHRRRVRAVLRHRPRVAVVGGGVAGVDCRTPRRRAGTVCAEGL